MKIMRAGKCRMPAGIPFVILLGMIITCAAAATASTYPLWDGKETQADYARRAGIAQDEIALDLGGGVTIKCALIPAGKFIMGSPADEPNRVANEGPQHEVTISRPFCMGVYDVTQEQFQSVMGENPSHFQGPARPVDGVSWEQATEFCKRLSQKTGQTVELPTEAQWEFACRAGSRTRYCFGDDEKQLPDYANYARTFEAGTLPVGSKKPNAWGLFDMHGNVWEWCSDWFANSYPAAPQVDPAGPASGERKVLRGGGWECSFRYCRSAIRYWGAPTRESIIVGFRVVVESR
jgi:formylglycine-generating enzyme required for sulfatase activity